MPANHTHIKTEEFSAQLRAKAVDTAGQRLLITDFRSTSQEADLSVPPNCEGYGRVRHFRRETSTGWPSNPLPSDPAARALGLERSDIIEAQVFQNAICNWRCWYCFVPFELLAAKAQHSAWFSAAQLVELFREASPRPRMIDLTGGQPDLVPEWIPWMMEALQKRDLAGATYLWSDDNLSNDYYFRFLSDAQRELIAGYRNYGRVCCFKGFNSESFSFNTKAAPELFEQQFRLFQRLLAEGMDLYAYATFTSPNAARIPEDIAIFVDKLQDISENLPLRTVLLEISPYTPVVDRGIESIHVDAMTNQIRARDAWHAELQKRFSASMLESASRDVTAVAL